MDITTAKKLIDEAVNDPNFLQNFRDEMSNYEEERKQWMVRRGIPTHFTEDQVDAYDYLLSMEDDNALEVIDLYKKTRNLQ